MIVSLPTPDSRHLQCNTCGHPHYATPVDTHTQIMDTPKHIPFTIIPTQTTPTLTSDPLHGHNHLPCLTSAPYAMDPHTTHAYGDLTTPMTTHHCHHQHYHKPQRRCLIQLERTHRMSDGSLTHTVCLMQPSFLTWPLIYLYYL